MKFFQPNLSDGTHIISNPYDLILVLELRSRIGNNLLNLMENLKHRHSPSGQKPERVKGDILDTLSIYFNLNYCITLRGFVRILRLNYL
jgi:hypothetical protein